MMLVSRIFSRDPKTAEPKQIGSVVWDGQRVRFVKLGKGMKASLRRIKAKGKEYKPADGAAYVRALPWHLRGSYLWAAKARKVA